MASSNPDEPELPSASFEEALARLEVIVVQLEEGQIGLAEALARYESGVGLLRRCYQLLENAERKIELLNQVDSAGRTQCEPMDDGVVSLEERAQTRGRRRSRAAPDGESAPPGLFDE